jgi:2,3-bisphosphoglycerate-independent phosphoglycerate mutase
MTFSIMADKKTPTVLIILDGFGYREATEDNAIAHANAPTWQHLWQTYPHTLVATSGLAVGLPDGQMGNSEVGHMSLGAGRIIYQNITRIDKAISDGDFFTNKTYCTAIDKAIKANKAVHIMGLLSPGGVHSHQEHIFAMVKMAHQRGAKAIYVHAILDGRDTPPRSADEYLQQLQEVCDANNAHIATIIGRYFAMDRDNRWDRVEQAYALYTQSQAQFNATTAKKALQLAYSRDENDEFVKATLINNTPSITDGDAVIFMNFRSDRAREITRAFVDDDFNDFSRPHKLALADFVTTTEYAANIKAPIAFPTERITDVFPEYIANLGKTQLRIAETEKYAHVTFFFSGGKEELYEGEERILVPSPNIATYDLQPEMSAPEVTEKLVDAIKSGKYDAIICNYANGDMVGHTGSFSAAVKAVEALDACLKKVTDAVLEMQGHCLITADHGNCEQMLDYETHQLHTQHTTGPVPLVYVSNNTEVALKNGGKLADIAPTLLALMQLKQPAAMTGISLIE